MREFENLKMNWLTVNKDMVGLFVNFPVKQSSNFQIKQFSN